jgi:hypothetical protein
MYSFCINDKMLRFYRCRLKMAQTEKMCESKTYLNVKEENLQEMRRKEEELRDGFRLETKRNSDLRLLMQQHQLKKKALENEEKNRTLMIKSLTRENEMLVLHFMKSRELIENTTDLKKYITDLSNTYFLSSKGTSPSDVSSFRERECQALQRQIRTAQDIKKRSTKVHGTNLAKINQDSKVLNKVCSLCNLQVTKR